MAEWQISGADKSNGTNREMDVVAGSEAEALALANQRGLFVDAIKEIPVSRPSAVSKNNSIVSAILLSLLIGGTVYYEQQQSKQASTDLQDSLDTSDMSSKFSAVGMVYKENYRKDLNRDDQQRIDNLLDLMTSLDQKWFAQYHAAEETDKKILLAERTAKQNVVLSLHLNSPQEVEAMANMMENLVKH